VSHLTKCVDPSLNHAGKLSKGEKLMAVDHATVDYPPFRRRFYIEVPEIQRMSDEEVAAARKTEGIKVSRGLWLSSRFDLSGVGRLCWDGPWGQHTGGGGVQVDIHCWAVLSHYR
jgi:hypothetical protein